MPPIPPSLSALLISSSTGARRKHFTFHVLLLYYTQNLKLIRTGLGDFEKYPETALSIDVQRFFKTKAAKPPSATSYITPALVDETTRSSNNLQGDMEMTDAPSSGLIAVKSSTSYTVDDPEAPGGKKNLYREDLAKGYAYGRTAVYLSESEQNIATLQTLKSFSIIGFIPSDGVSLKARFNRIETDVLLVCKVSLNGRELCDHCSTDRREVETGVLIAGSCTSGIGLLCRG